MLKKTVTLTDAQIKALPTTPIEIVAAPGSGKIILPFFVSFFADTLAGAYTNIDVWAQSNVYVGALALVLDAATVYNNATGAVVSSNLLGSTKKSIGITGPVNATTIGALLNAALTANDAINVGYAQDITSGFDNKNLSIAAINTGNFTGGNAANTMKVTVWYDIITL